MFELPEYLTLARQMNDTIRGRTVQRGQLGNSPHKFVWYNRTHDEFERLTKGKTVGEAKARGRWLFIPLEPGYVLVLGECGGKVVYHPEGSVVPQKYHLFITFDDGSFMTAMTQMWGAMELYERGMEQERQYVKDMRPTPTEPAFTFEYFSGLIDELIPGKKRSTKSLLTQDQLIPGLGNAIAQDILFRAGLHPRLAIADLTPGEREALYEAIVDTVREVTEKGGRYDEFDFFGNPGGYVRLMDKGAVDAPCPVCGTTVRKASYLGGSIYTCAGCQRL